jgi:hypothetical protein
MNTAPSNPNFVGEEARALELLSSGIEAEAVASALGLSAGRISQLIHEPEFAKALAERRFAALRKHNETDDAYDALEKQLIAQLKQVIPLAMRPMEIARILQVINSAKRRGASSPDSITAQRQTITLNIPVQVVNRFAVNAANQVVEAGTEDSHQSLVTIQSGSMQRLLNDHSSKQSPGTLVAPDAKHNSREWRAFRQLERATVKESNGDIWRKPQGHEKQDILAECGFTADLAPGTQST